MDHITHAQSSPLARRAPSPGTSVLARLWQIDRPLTGSSVLMLCALAHRGPDADLPTRALWYERDA